jgi:hypothetical protein
MKKAGRNPAFCFAGRTLFSGCVQAPGAGSGGGEIKENEAEEDRGIALIYHRKETLRGVSNEIGGGQKAREHKSSEAGEEAEDDENAADDLERAGKSHERENIDAIGKVFGGREVEIFGGAMLKQEQAGYDAEDGVKWAGPGGGDNSIQHCFAFDC